MLSVASSKVFVPVRLYNDGVVSWTIIWLDSQRTDVIQADKFNYTILIRWGDEAERMTFKYDHASVSPTGRTLRKFGADLCNKFVSRLAANSKTMYTAKDLIQSVNSEEPPQDLYRPKFARQQKAAEATERNKEIAKGFAPWAF